MNYDRTNFFLLTIAFLAVSQSCWAFTVAPTTSLLAGNSELQRQPFCLNIQTTDNAESTPTAEESDGEEELDYTIPEDAVIQIRPNAMNRLRELRSQQKTPDDVPLYLRMGVKSGGCSGMSYVMDFCGESDVTEDDVLDNYEIVQCVVDPKSVLYLYGLELDYSSELIGGGFKFFNPNAEESCGCGSSFGI